MTNPNTKIYIAGHLGMVGSAICRVLNERGYNNIITTTRDELDLTNQKNVRSFFEAERPEQVYLAAAKVGGIHANNTFPAEFIYENLMIEANVIHESWRAGVQRLLFLGSSCIYPKFASQPMTENALLTGQLEPTNEPYAIAKIAGIKLCESYNRQYGTDFRSVMPTNLYGPGDNYHPENSHVIPALIRRFHEAKKTKRDKVVVWGTGKARREFLYVDDMAEASVHVMELGSKVYDAQTNPMANFINIGAGTDTSICELAETIARITNFTGRIEFDPSKPDGPPRKLLSVDRMDALGWRAHTELTDGLRKAYSAYLHS